MKLAKPRPQKQPKPPLTRYHTFESLLLTGRAVKVKHRRDGKFAVVLHFAGEQNPDGTNKIAAITFLTKKGAEEAARAIRIDLLKANTDHMYNKTMTEIIAAAQEMMDRKKEQQDDV